MGEKARQYLDGLLEVPFGYYHKEQIFSFFKDYSDKLENFITILNCRIDDIGNEDVAIVLREIINNYYVLVDNSNESNVNNFMKFLEKHLLKFNDLDCEITFEDVEEESLKVEYVEKLGITITEKDNKKSGKDDQNNTKDLFGNYKDQKDLYKKSLNELKFYNNIKETLIGNGLLNDNHIDINFQEIGRCREEDLWR